MLGERLARRLRAGPAARSAWGDVPVTIGHRHAHLPRAVQSPAHRSPPPPLRRAEPIRGRQPGVEDIHEENTDWLEWVELIGVALGQRDPEDLRGVGPLALYDSDGVVTVPRWYVDKYRAGVVPA